MNRSYPGDSPPIDLRLVKAQTELDVLYLFGVAIHDRKDWHQLYRFLYDQAERLMPIDAALIAFLTPDRSKLQTVISIDEGSEYPLQPAWEFNPLGANGRVIYHAEAVRFNDLNVDLPIRFPAMAAAFNTGNFGEEEKRSRGWLTVPMMVEHEVKGLINVQSYQYGVYGEREERLLMTLGSMLAITVNQSQLIEQFETIRQALSAPLIPVSAQLTIVPLIGQLDSARMALVQRKLLTTIELQRVRHLVVDLTGVTEMHPETHHLLAQLIRAVALLGTTCTLSGVNADLARALAARGINLTGLAVVRDVEQGLIKFGALPRHQPR